MQKNIKGQIQVYTGTGKGKTTAGLGLLLRALGAGLKVNIIFFDKGGNFYSERKVLAKLKKLYPKKLDYYAFGTIRMVKGKGFRFENIAKDFSEAELALKQAKKLSQNQTLDVLILDEINTTVKTGLLTLKPIIELIKNKNPKLELVLTGRYCQPEILKLADLVTEMKDLKHYMSKGVPARPGIDY